MILQLDMQEGDTILCYIEGDDAEEDTSNSDASRQVAAAFTSNPEGGAGLELPPELSMLN